MEALTVVVASDEGALVDGKRHRQRAAFPYRSVYEELQLSDFREANTRSRAERFVPAKQMTSSEMKRLKTFVSPNPFGISCRIEGCSRNQGTTEKLGLDPIVDYAAGRLGDVPNTLAIEKRGAAIPQLNSKWR